MGFEREEERTCLCPLYVRDPCSHKVTNVLIKHRLRAGADKEERERVSREVRGSGVRDK